MKSSKGNTNTQEEEDEYEEDFSSKKEGTSASKDSRNNDKVSAMRSKHSVTEQRRRSKINERFQILRDLIPGDQKKDTASFLLEVIEYVQLLQEKVQKYEGSYQGWSNEPAKLMPWRHSHWRVQSFLGHPQAVKNGPTPAFPGKYDERSASMNPSVVQMRAPGDGDSSHDAFRALDHEQPDLAEKAGPMSASSMQVPLPTAVRNDGETSSLFPQRQASDDLSSVRSDGEQQGEHVIEGGTISISGAYSHGLLMTLTQALQSSGVDLSQASISIRIDIGKRANQNLLPRASAPKEPENPASSHDIKTGHVRDGGGEEEFDPPQKKLRS